jgi:lipopolysaccharide heptosyltransferase II
VAALSHFGNWEINAQIAEFVKPRKAGCVYQALRSRRMDDLVNSDRRSRGVFTFDRKKEMQGASSLLREGGVVGVLTDQHAGNAGIWMPLFGKLASTSPLAASLAQRTGSLLSMVSVRTVGIARWEIHTSDPVPTEGRETADITTDLNRLLEEEIRRSPEDWFWVHNRWKVPHPNFLLSGSKRGIHLPAGTDPSALDPFRIVIRSPNWLGDACMAIPAVRAIKEGRPDARVTLLAPEKLAPLWREVPGVDAVLSFPMKASPWRVSRILSKAGPQDVAILLPNSQRSALEAFLAGIPRRVARDIHRGGKLVNQRMSLPKQLHPTRHQSEELLAMIRGLGGGDPGPRPSRKAPQAPLRVALCPGAEYGPAKRWLADRYRAVMERLSGKYDLTWVVVGTAKERDLGEHLTRDFPGSAENLCGSTTLPQLIDLLKGCALLLTNDTGTMHLADALGIPVVAIFGSTEPALTGPVGSTTPPHTILRRKVECSPCYLRECPMDFRCMKEISVDMVTAAVEESLSLFQGLTGMKGIKGMDHPSEVISP